MSSERSSFEAFIQTRDEGKKDTRFLESRDSHSQLIAQEVTDSEPELTVTENEFFSVLTDPDGTYLEIIKSKAGQELLNELTEEYNDLAKLESGIELVQTNFDLLTRQLKDRFNIDDPEAYSDKLSNSWIAMVSHSAKSVVNPEFRMIFEDYLKQAELLNSLQADREEIKAGKIFIPEEKLAEVISSERWYLAKRAARMSVGPHNSPSPTGKATLRGE